MHLKVIISFVSVILMGIIGFVGVRNLEVDKSSVDSELGGLNETIENVNLASNNEVENNNLEESTNEAQNIAEENEKIDQKETIAVTEAKTNSDSKTLQTTTKKEQTTSNQQSAVEKDQPQQAKPAQNEKVPETPKKEETKTEKPQEVTEKYVYNGNEIQKIISDINTIAKRNSSLWGANGEKLYKIEISSSIKNKNYMSPYKYSQVEGIVLNVFPVKFLVYAEDYIKTGYETKTRYYIDVTNY